MTDSEIVAKEIGLQYYSLDSVGIHSVAFDKENALKLLKYCRDEVIPIVGIDVYKLNSGNVDFSDDYDNWSCEMKSNENFCEYVKRSYKLALVYICNSNYHDNSLFDIVIFHLHRGPCLHYC